MTFGGMSENKGYSCMMCKIQNYVKKSQLDKFLIVSSKGTVERNAKSSWLFNNILDTFFTEFLHWPEFIFIIFRLVF